MQVECKEFWQLFFHVSVGNFEGVKTCIENRVLERFNMKDLIVAIAVANGHAEVLQVLLQHVSADLLEIRRQSVNSI